MTTIHLQGEITGQGTLEVKLPAGLPPGVARITIELGRDPEWSTEEIERALHGEPLTGAEIVAAGLTGGWSGAGIEDSAQWVSEQRRQRREDRDWTR